MPEGAKTETPKGLREIVSEIISSDLDEISEVKILVQKTRISADDLCHTITSGLRTSPM